MPGLRFRNEDSNLAFPQQHRPADSPRIHNGSPAKLCQSIIATIFAKGCCLAFSGFQPSTLDI
jgi:hypothetical protein